MEHFLPEIYWHDRQGILALDILSTRNKIKMTDKKSEENGNAAVSGGEKNEKKRNVAVSEEEKSEKKGNAAVSFIIATASMQKEIRIWQLSFEEAREKQHALCVQFVANLFGAHNSSINTLRFAPGEDARMLVSGDSDGRIVFWGIGDGPPGPPEDPDFPPNRINWVRQKVAHHDSDVCAVAWDRLGTRIASVSRDNCLLVHDASGKRMMCVRNLREFPNGVAWDPAGKFIVTMSTDRKMEVIDAVKGTKLRVIGVTDLPRRKLKGEKILLKPYKLFHDDQMTSFKRSPSFSPCGQLMVAPCAHLEVGKSNVYGTYVFKRSDLNGQRPSWLLPSPRITFFIQMCPLLFELDPSTEENYSGLPYRAVWAALSDCAVYIYDSQHSTPIGLADSMHYNILMEASWSDDGRLISIASLEGYCSFLLLDLKRLGDEVKEYPAMVDVSEEKSIKTPSRKRKAGEEKEKGKELETQTAATPPGKKTRSSPASPLIPPRPSAPPPGTPTLHAFFSKKTTPARPPPIALESSPATAKTGQENDIQAQPKKRIQLIHLAD